MKLLFVLPGPLRVLAANRSEINVSGEATTVGEALALLWQECPALRDRVMTELSTVRTHVNLYVNGESIRYSGGLRTSVADGAEIVILAAVSGG